MHPSTSTSTAPAMKGQAALAVLALACQLCPGRAQTAGGALDLALNGTKIIGVSDDGHVSAGSPGRRRCAWAHAYVGLSRRPAPCVRTSVCLGDGARAAAQAREHRFCEASRRARVASALTTPPPPPTRVHSVQVVLDPLEGYAVHVKQQLSIPGHKDVSATLDDTSGRLEAVEGKTDAIAAVRPHAMPCGCTLYS